MASRFYRWQKAGIWQKVLEALQEQSEAADELDWEQHYVDSTVIRAHQHAAGATGENPKAEALGRSQGGFSTKLHLRAEGKGKPMTLVLTPGQYHEAPLFETLMEQGAVKRANGRLKRRPKRLIADKGYSSKNIRLYLRQRNIRYVTLHFFHCQHDVRSSCAATTNENCRLRQWASLVSH